MAEDEGPPPKVFRVARMVLTILLLAMALSQIVAAISHAVVHGIGFAAVFWLLAGAAFLLIGWAGLKAVRRGENPFAALRRKPRGTQ